MTDAIYRMNWPLLSINEKKGLLMIMIRSTIPIKFTSSFLITLSLQSYSNVSNIIMKCISISVIKFLCNIINICDANRKISKFFNNYTLTFFIIYLFSDLKNVILSI